MSKKPDQVTTIPTLPDWVNETPDECDYELVMFGEDWGEVQKVQITRSEYLDLKQHLAKMRGIRKSAPKKKPGSQAARGKKKAG